MRRLGDLIDDHALGVFLMGVVIALTAGGIGAAKAADAPEQRLLEVNGPDGGAVAAFVLGAAEGPKRASLVIPSGDLRLRNVQGDGPNLDLGGGCGHADACRGDVVVNFDVGNAARIFDGRRRLMLRVDGRGVLARGRDGVLRYLGGSR